MSMEFFKQVYWSGLLFPTPGDLPDPGIESRSPASAALAGGLNSINILGYVAKNPPAKQEMQETWVQSLDQEDPLE